MKRICDIAGGVMFKLGRTGDTYIKMHHGVIVDESGKSRPIHHLSNVTPIRKLEDWEITVLKEKYNAWSRPDSIGTTATDMAKIHEEEIRKYKEAIAVLKDEIATLSTEAASLRTILYHVAKLLHKGDAK